MSTSHHPASVRWIGGCDKPLRGRLDGEPRPANDGVGDSMQARPVCTIVGMGPGVALAVARRFAAEGHTIAMIARDEARLAGHAEALQAAGYTARAFAADAGDAAALGAAFTAIHGELGPTAVLIYNAAVLKPGTPSTLAPTQLEMELRVNVVGALVSAQAVLPGMRQAGQGTIVFTGGGLALEPAARFASLAIGKAGVRSLALSLAQELAPAGIHVATVTICGFVRPGTRFDPDEIAAAYLRLHGQPREAWEREVTIR